MPAKSSARKWVCAKPVAPPSSPSAEFAQRIATSALARLGDRLTVGLQTLTLPIQVRILVPQPYTQNPPQGGFCVCGWGEGKSTLPLTTACLISLLGWFARRFDAAGRMPEANIAAWRRWPDRAAGRIARRSTGPPAIHPEPAARRVLCVWRLGRRSPFVGARSRAKLRSEGPTSELPSLMRFCFAVFFL